MKTIGMLVAVEIDAVLSRYGTAASREQRCGFEILGYDMEGYRLYVVHSGIGELAAAAATQLLIDRYQVDLVVNFGVVGGLIPELKLTHTCVVEKVVHYDFDLSGIDPVAPAQYPGFEDVYIPATPELVARATELAPELKRVICASADKFVDSAADKAELHEAYGAEICEMESAGVLLTCHRCGVPCLLIKTVSDSIEGGANEYYSELEKSSALCLALTDRIIREL